MTDSNSCAITNNISVTSIPAAYAGSAQTGWDGSIVCINAYNTGTDTALQVYEQTLSLLPFASGSTTLPETKSSTIELNVTYPGTTSPAVIYDLIFAQSNNYFPVLDISTMQGFVAPYSYSPITISTNNISSTANAFQFYQDICAFPTSTLAQNFTAAVNSTSQSANTAASITSAMSQFFANTKAYQNVSYDGYIAVTTYLNTFAYAWANFASTYTYYIFTSGTITDASSGTIPTAKALGTITFTRTGTAAGVTDTSGGYTIVYTDTSSKKTTLYFSSGQLVSSTTQDVPSIALQFSFAQLSQYTSKSSDGATIVPIIAGNIYGTKVLGIGTNIANVSSPDVLTAIQNFFDSKGMADTLMVMNLAMGLDVICKGLKGLSKLLIKSVKANLGKNPTPAQVDQAKTLNNADTTKNLAKSQKVANRLSSSNKVSTDVAGQQKAATTTLEAQSVNEQIQVQEEEVDNAESELLEEAKLEVNKNMNDDASNLKKAMKKVVDLSKELTTDPSVIDSTETQLNTNEKSISTAKTDLEAQAKTEAKSFTAEQEEKVTLAQDTLNEEQAEQKEKNAELENEKTGEEPTSEGEKIHFDGK